ANMQVGIGNVSVCRPASIVSRRTDWPAGVNAGASCANAPGATRNRINPATFHRRAAIQPSSDHSSYGPIKGNRSVARLCRDTCRPDGTITQLYRRDTISRRDGSGSAPGTRATPVRVGEPLEAARDGASIAVPAPAVRIARVYLESPPLLTRTPCR